MKSQNEKNGKVLATDQQMQAAKDDQEQEQNEGQRNVGPLKLAGRAILLVIENRIGVKKIDESDEYKKIE